MSIIELEITSDIYNCTLQFERRLSVIKGDSGVGKSTLAELVSQELIGVSVKSTYPIVVVTEQTWQTVVKGEQDKILLFDDLDVVETAMFATMYAEYGVKNNLFFIIIARESLESVKELYSIYDMKKDGIYHWLVSTTPVNSCVVF